MKVFTAVPGTQKDGAGRPVLPGDGLSPRRPVPGPALAARAARAARAAGRGPVRRGVPRGGAAVTWGGGGQSCSSAAIAALWPPSAETAPPRTAPEPQSRTEG